MRTQTRIAHWGSIVFVATLAGCGSSGEDPIESGGTAGSSGAAGTSTAGSSGASAAGSGGTSGMGAGGTSAGSGGTGANTGGGAGGASGASGSMNTGGSTAGVGGAGGSSNAGSSGTTTAGTAGSAGAGGGAAGGCTLGAWPAADPAMQGPFEVVTEENVGPAAGAEGEAFTMFRPAELGQDGLCHPIVTWGNGTGSSPSLYGVMLRHLASHGFIVIASDSPQVAQGDPPPMVAGVDWVHEQNADPASPLYQHVDTTHAGATGHSQGGFATTQAAGDDNITTIAPLCGASTQRNLHGPALILCGGADDVVPCSSVEGAFDNIDDQPAMLATYVSADHANWVTFRGTEISPMETATVAWMRLHLMGDTTLRSWFYGADCELCTNPDWEITQKMMD